MGLLYNPVFSAAALGFLAATWAGLQQMKEQIDVFRKLVPQYPFFWETWKVLKDGKKRERKDGRMGSKGWVTSPCLMWGPCGE